MSLCRSLTRLLNFVHPQVPLVSRYFAAEDGGKDVEEAGVARARKAVNRAVYRAKQRGHLELDLLLGKFTEGRVAAMSGQQLVETEQLLTEENPDLWKWLTEQQTPPAHVERNTIFQELAETIRIRLDGVCAQQTRAPQGREWINAWQDPPQVQKQH